ncbi:hypothetical protein PR048_026281 [Dryococelus australis]|uniref:Uncharacterized protein n=1 Tax=Dryococelus australis TaxID=614101 RepID=A0ABQ9GKV9_9NEOP|nr:hypothetical protein PR048_026281 [Dryococelus australis]
MQVSFKEHECYDPTEAGRVQSPTGSLPDFRKWDSWLTMPLVGGFFFGVSRFPRPCIPALLRTRLTAPSSALMTKTSMLRAGQISPLHFTTSLRNIATTACPKTAFRHDHTNCTAQKELGSGITDQQHTSLNSRRRNSVKTAHDTATENLHIPYYVFRQPLKQTKQACCYFVSKKYLILRPLVLGGRQTKVLKQYNQYLICSKKVLSLIAGRRSIRACYVIRFAVTCEGVHGLVSGRVCPVKGCMGSSLDECVQDAWARQWTSVFCEGVHGLVSGRVCPVKGCMGSSLDECVHEGMHGLVSGRVCPVKGYMGSSVDECVQGAWARHWTSVFSEGMHGLVSGRVCPVKGCMGSSVDECVQDAWARQWTSVFCEGVHGLVSGRVCPVKGCMGSSVDGVCSVKGCIGLVSGRVCPVKGCMGSSVDECVQGAWARQWTSVSSEGMHGLVSGRVCPVKGCMGSSVDECVLDAWARHWTSVFSEGMHGLVSGRVCPVKGCMGSSVASVFCEGCMGSSVDEVSMKGCMGSSWTSVSVRVHGRSGRVCPVKDDGSQAGPQDSVLKSWARVSEGAWAVMDELYEGCISCMLAVTSVSMRIMARHDDCSEGHGGGRAMFVKVVHGSEAAGWSCIEGAGSSDGIWRGCMARRSWARGRVVEDACSQHARVQAVRTVSEGYGRCIAEISRHEGVKIWRDEVSEDMARIETQKGMAQCEFLEGMPSEECVHKMQAQWSSVFVKDAWSIPDICGLVVTSVSVKGCMGSSVDECVHEGMHGLVSGRVCSVKGAWARQWTSVSSEGCMGSSVTSVSVKGCMARQWTSVSSEGMHGSSVDECVPVKGAWARQWTSCSVKGAWARQWTSVSSEGMHGLVSARVCPVKGCMGSSVDECVLDAWARQWTSVFCEGMHGLVSGRVCPVKGCMGSSVDECVQGAWARQWTSVSSEGCMGSSVDECVCEGCMGSSVDEVCPVKGCMASSVDECVQGAWARQWTSVFSEGMHGSSVDECVLDAWARQWTSVSSEGMHGLVSGRVCSVKGCMGSSVDECVSSEGMHGLVSGRVCPVKGCMGSSVDECVLEGMHGLVSGRVCSVKGCMGSSVDECVQ